MAIPKWRVVEHEHDGHTSFQCLSCYKYFNSTGELEGWRFCPFCGIEWEGQHLCRYRGSPRWFPVTFVPSPYGVKVECWPEKWPQTPDPTVELVIQENCHTEPKWQDRDFVQLGPKLGAAFHLYLLLRGFRQEIEDDVGDFFPGFCRPEYRVIKRPYHGRTYYSGNRDHYIDELKRLGIIKS